MAGGDATRGRLRGAAGPAWACVVRF